MSRSHLPSHRNPDCCLVQSPPDSVVYTGCVGDDDLAQELRVANDKEGLKDAYLVKKEEVTGACAVVITGHNRYVLL